MLLPIYQQFDNFIEIAGKSQLLSLGTTRAALERGFLTMSTKLAKYKEVIYKVSKIGALYSCS
ncbi:hypothetical protein MUO_00445 [Listeria monocytogenes 07PF0776]|nr:hypothetical protein MUO_00445 [Listeria monocytogenes 07PF0776]